MSLSLGIGGLIIIGIYHTTNSCNQSLLIGELQVELFIMDMIIILLNVL